MCDAMFDTGTCQSHIFSLMILLCKSHVHIEKLYFSLFLSLTLKNYFSLCSALPQVSTFMPPLIIIMLSSSDEVLQTATQVAQTPNVSYTIFISIPRLHTHYQTFLQTETTRH